MHFHQNHCWCSESNWGGTHYDSRYMVSIDKTFRYQHLDERVDNLTDWGKVATTCEVYCPEDFEWIREDHEKQGRDASELDFRKAATKKNVPTLRPEIIEWLNEKILDVKDKDQPKGWCYGSDTYRKEDYGSITLWFARRRDAMAFIKHFSVYKKPTTYLNYFKDDYRELHEGKLKKFDRRAKKFQGCNVTMEDE